MVKSGKTALLVSVLIPSAVFAEVSIGDQFGISETAIRSSLEAKGYTATEIEIEDGEIEIEAMSDGQSLEFEVSPDTGLVLATYEEVDEDGKDYNDEDDADEYERDEDNDGEVSDGNDEGDDDD